MIPHIDNAVEIKGVEIELCLGGRVTVEKFKRVHRLSSGEKRMLLLVFEKLLLKKNLVKDIVEIHSVKVLHVDEVIPLVLIEQVPVLEGVHLVGDLEPAVGGE